MRSNVFGGLRISRMGHNAGCKVINSEEEIAYQQEKGQIHHRYCGDANEHRPGCSYVLPVKIAHACQEGL